MTYTVFIGCWSDGEPEWTSFREGGLTWEAARDELAKHLDFEDDDCPSCRHDAADELSRLQEARPGKFEAFVDGDDYLIVPD